MIVHDLYIADEPPSGRPEDFDTGLTTELVVERVVGVIRQNFGGERLHICIETRTVAPSEV